MHFRVSHAIVIVLTMASMIFGQGTPSRLVGVLLDPSGASVVGAPVRLTNQGTGAVFNTVSGDGGAYSFEALQPGKYEISVEAAGFRKFVSRDNAVTIGQPTTAKVTVAICHVAGSM